MTNYFDKYKKRISSKGKNKKESYLNNSINFIENHFHEYPNYKKVTIDGLTYETRMVSGRKRSDRELILKPNTIAPLGGIVDVDGDKWLVFEYIEEVLSPKVLIRRCNNDLKWSIGASSYETPVFIENYNAQDVLDREYNSHMDFDLIKGGIYVYCQINNDTKTIDYGQRFILGENAFQATGIDDVTLASYGKGILKITMKVDIKHQNDDFTNKTADNSNESGGGMW